MDFNIIPLDTKIIIINIPYKYYSKNSSFLCNLPISLQEIHFNRDEYLFNETSNSGVNNETSQFNNYDEIVEHKMKIPFGCKIYKFNKEIMNYDGLVKIKIHYSRVGGIRCA